MAILRTLGTTASIVVQASQRKSVEGALGSLPPVSVGGSGGAPSETVTVGRWSIVAPLARGGMADVYLARDAEGDEVVIKRVREDLPTDVGYDLLLLAEAQLTASLRHPNVVRVIDHGRSQDTEPYFVMEYVAGLDLHRLLRECSRRKVRFPLGHRLAVVCGVLRALDYAHRARDERGAPFDIIHRDISPANVLVGFDGEVKLCDFGIATATVMPDVPATSGIEGKASYMSPEQARGECLDQRSDVYAVGILLWEMLSGRRMRKKKGATTRLVRAARGEVPPLAVRGLPGEEQLHAIVHRALSFEREDRFDAAHDLMRALERWCREHDMLVGESELGRFMRTELRAVRDEQQGALDEARAHAGAPPAWMPDAEEVSSPSHSGPRRIRRAEARKPGWPRSLAYLLAAAAASFAAATAASWLGLV